jgi:zinc protease
MMTPVENPTSVEQDVEKQAQTVADAPKELKKTHTKVNKRKFLVASTFIACVCVLVGLLVARPWQTSNNNHTQEQTTTEGTNSKLAEPWPHETSDIAPDPRVTYGTLENGLRYMIMNNSEPPNQLMLRMHVNAGSYHEEEDQLGLAHFLEHMAFNGLRSFDADELIPVMQRLGIAFGAHANAATYFDETYYELNLPNATDDEALETSFAVMRDWADGMLLEEDEIEKERGVVLSELTMRDSVSYRLTKLLWSFLLPGHRLPSRWPGGEPDVIANVPRQRFLDFYEKYYRPERITIIACGDVDPREMELRITEAYESMVSNNQLYDTKDDPDLLGTVTPRTGFEAAVFTDEGLTDEEVFLTFARPYDMPADTKSERVSQLPLLMAHSIISRRLQTAAKQEGSPFRTGSASGSGREGILGRSGIETGTIGVTLASSEDTNWEDSIQILSREFRRALQFGFAPHEIDEVKANYMSFFERQVEIAPTRLSESLATMLRDTIKDKSVFSSPEQDLQIYSSAIESTSSDQILASFQSFWDTSHKPFS